MLFLLLFAYGLAAPALPARNELWPPSLPIRRRATMASEEEKKKPKKIAPNGVEPDSFFWPFIICVVIVTIGVAMLVFEVHVVQHPKVAHDEL